MEEFVHQASREGLDGGGLFRRRAQDRATVCGGRVRLLDPGDCWGKAVPT